MPTIIKGRTSPGILSKADRLFRNDDAGTFVEVLQNARRAGASRVDITLESQPEDLTSLGFAGTEAAGASFCVVTVHDDGDGIQNFQRLVTLGDSGWDQDTQATEDPAGMGFFSLCLSGVEVSSGCRHACIRPDVFLGKDYTSVEERDEYVTGTRLRFIRHSDQQTLTTALKAVAQFCPLEVRLNGETLASHDFLAGAIHREMIDGIEVGLSTSFENSWSRYGDKNWNFYGACIQEKELNFPGVLTQTPYPPHVISLFTRFNVVETGRVKLQLPDRKHVIQDDFLREFEKKVRAAAYRCFEKLGRHAMPYRNWKEAKQLGVDLREAVCLLTSWSAGARDDNIDYVFGVEKTEVLSDLTRVMLIERDVDCSHTLDAALHSGATLDADLYHEKPEFSGYSWYDTLPRVSGVEVLIDDTPAEEYTCQDGQQRPAKIEVLLEIEQRGSDVRCVTLPAQIHVRSDDWNEISFVAVRNSPWDNDDLSGPFPLSDFLMSATFCASEDTESDSWYTQRDYHEQEIEGQLNRYFRGSRATLLAVLNKALTGEARSLADDLSVSEIKFKRPSPGAHQWTIELIVPTTQPPQHA